MNIIEFEGKNIEEILSNVYKKLEVEPSDIIYTEEKGKSGLFKSAHTILKVVKIEEVNDYIKQYLKGIFTAMNIDVSYESKIRNSQISIKMYSDKNSILIGRNGQTLKALQTILKQVIFQQIKMYPNVILDVENYKDKQKFYLEKLAKKTAKEVATTKIEATLENMNSYERRVVHSALTNFKGIYTTSEGEEPNRHIVIKPSSN